MKSLMIKYLTLVLSGFILLFSKAFAYPQEVPCASGENISGYTCDSCFEDRFYMGDYFDYWDNFIPERNSVVFSSSRSKTIFDLNTSYIVHNGVPGRDDTRIVSNYMPLGGLGDVFGAKNDAIIFANENFEIVGHSSSRDDILGRILYNVHYAQELNSGTPLIYEWGYTDYNEVDMGTYIDIEYAPVNLGTSTKYIDTSDVIEHNECVSFRVDFCGDGAVSGPETCDPTDPSQTAWGDGGCSTTCEPINDDDDPSCSLLTVTPTSGVESFIGNMSCVGLNTDNYRIDIERDSLVLESINSSTGTYNFNSIGTYNVTCYVEDTITNSSCTQNVIVSEDDDDDDNNNGGNSGPGPSRNNGGDSSYCGDGIVQRPNSNRQLEECDFGNNEWPAYCSSDCKIIENTIPNIGGDLDISPDEDFIIGVGMNPFEEYLIFPNIYNESDSDIYFDRLCIYKGDGNSLAVNGGKICSDYNDILEKGGDPFSFRNYPNIKGLMPSDNFPNFEDNTLTISIEIEDREYRNAFFAEELKVRVSKPSIATTGGGTSYVNNTDISDISDVSNSQENKNFVGAGISKRGISSYSKDITDPESVQEVGEEGEDYNKALKLDSDLTGMRSSSNYYSIINDFKLYNGINNAHILKEDGNFIIKNGTLERLAGEKTYIIENGDLIIEGDIDYSDNIAFVVKGGDIKIDQSVENINGILIAIPNGSSGGEIIGIGGPTTSVLNIKGSLYGNIEKLVSERTYIKQNKSGQLDIGTVVSFGSSVFRSPAPLTSTFISEYLEATKIAQ